MTKYDIVFRSTPITNRKIIINIKNFFAKKFLFYYKYLMLKVIINLNNKNINLLSNIYININMVRNNAPPKDFYCLYDYSYLDN